MDDKTKQRIIISALEMKLQELKFEHYRLNNYPVEFKRANELMEMEIDNTIDILKEMNEVL